MTFQGPLPIVDAGSILQEQSKRALQAALPLSDYIFRDERLDDYGVDGAIELLANSRATNVRAQVQLKGRSNTQVNKSGAVSIQVSTANLNYLLNGSCPLYILFRPESSELRFALARDEWARIERDNANWRDQQWINIHFHRILTPDSLAELRRLIANEAAVRRGVDERLNVLRVTTGHAVTIDAQSLEVADSSQVLDMLSQIGQALTNSGLAKQVIERARLVPTDLLLKTPRAALAVVYAHFHLSHYYDASAAIRQLLLSNPPLDADSRALLDVLHVSVRRMLGEIGEDQYNREIDAWSMHAPTDLAIQYAISRAWSDYTKTIARATPEHVRAIAKEKLHAALLRGRSIQSQRVANHIELLELTLRQHEIEDMAIDAQALNHVAAIGIGDAHLAREQARAPRQLMEVWLKAVNELAAKTSRAEHRTYCHVLLLKNHAALAAERQRRYVEWSQDNPKSQDRADVGTLVESAQETLRVARALEDRDLELSAMLMLAETLDTCGSEEDATALATDALRIAELSGSALHVRQASHFLSGADRSEARKREMMQFAAKSEEEIIRDAGDDQVEFMAGALANAYQLPMYRAPNILYSLLCQRQLARERRDWCKHIAHAEHDGHRGSLITMYAERPPIKIVCLKLRKEALVQASDASLVSEDFRRRHCQTCIHRSPDIARPVTERDKGALQGRTLRNKAKAMRRRRRLGSG
ncbi:DUF4365 domain-containing protein [Sorangium sp. So ce834]|uniref:DUF4365 domain-containing protein n=1 Tax=Sorangium sp. So ce834 TaxID=3133321 RepID=UPI003F60C081